MCVTKLCRQIWKSNAITINCKLNWGTVSICNLQSGAGKCSTPWNGLKLAFSPGGFRRYRGCRVMTTAGITNPRNDRTGSVRQTNASRALKTQTDAPHVGHSQNERVERGFWSRGHFYERDLLWDRNNEGWEDTYVRYVPNDPVCVPFPLLFFWREH